MAFRKYLILILLFTILFSCTDEKGDNNIVGPCIHEYKEAVFHVTSVRDTVNDSFINFVKIKNLKIDGIVQNNFWITGNSYSIAVSDSVIYCNVPFGFGYMNGTYEFTLEAPGYAPKNFVITDVEYSINEGDCPSYSNGGKRVQLVIN